MDVYILGVGMRNFIVFVVNEIFNKKAIKDFRLSYVQVFSLALLLIAMGLLGSFLLVISIVYS